jgi:hypothetical protein
MVRWWLPGCHRFHEVLHQELVRAAVPSTQPHELLGQPLDLVDTGDAEVALAEIPTRKVAEIVLGDLETLA